MLDTGVLDLGNSAVTLTLSGFSDFTHGQIINCQSASVSGTSASILMLPAGFDTSTAFGSFSSAGIVHFAGTPLVVPAGKSIGSAAF